MIVIYKFKKVMLITMIAFISLLINSCKNFSQVTYEKKLYYPNKVLKEKYAYFEGKSGDHIFHGKRFFYSEDGKIKTIENYKNGKLHGLVEQFSEYYKQKFMFNEGIIQWLKTYNKYNKQISFCNFIGGKVSEGSIWHYVKNSCIKYYKNGKIVKELECDKYGKIVEE